MKLLLGFVLASYLFCLAPCSDAQTPSSVPSLIARCKPVVVAIGFWSAEKLPEEVQLPMIYEGKSPTGKAAYLYVNGSGFVASSDGYVVTAQHVIDHLPEPISVIMPSGTVLNGKLMLASAEHDYAILKVDLKDAPFLQFGKYQDMLEGDEVLYIGHPFGDPGEVSSRGMISRMGTDGSLGDFIQLNAIVNSGNSGGPLISIDSGRVVGIVRAKYGKLSPYLKGLKDGSVAFTMNIQSGGFDLQHFVKDVANMMDLHIQMGIGYAVSSGYAEKA